MLERLQEGHRFALRSLLSLVTRRSVDLLVERLMQGARRRSRREQRPLPIVLFELHESVRNCVARRLRRMGTRDLWSARAWMHGDPSRIPRFMCDGSLGGLSRWLRAAGYEAEWAAQLTACDALERALDGQPIILITTDSHVLDRPEVRSGAVIVLWVPSNMRRIDQAAWVMRDLSLVPRKPRCMTCGGELVSVDKRSVVARIPPRTARWKDEYQLCQGCGRLFWEGTHWERIRVRLTRL